MSSALHSPIRSPNKFVKPSPVGKVGYNKDFLLGSFDEEKFLQYLNAPSSPPAIEPFDRDIDMTSFLSKANEVALYIKKQREHCLFLYLAFLADI
jgi:hypothetical protein